MDVPQLAIAYPIPPINLNGIPFGGYQFPCGIKLNEPYNLNGLRIEDGPVNNTHPYLPLFYTVKIPQNRAGGMIIKFDPRGRHAV
mgnify:FL=1